MEKVFENQKCIKVSLARVYNGPLLLKTEEKSLSKTATFLTSAISTPNLLENPFNNLIKNQEFKLFILPHFKNIISPKPAWNSQWSPILLRNLKRWRQLPIFCPYFIFFFKKKDFSKSLVNLDIGI